MNVLNTNCTFKNRTIDGINAIACLDINGTIMDSINKSLNSDYTKEEENDNNNIDVFVCFLIVFFSTCALCCIYMCCFDCINSFLKYVSKKIKTIKAKIFKLVTCFYCKSRKIIEYRIDTYDFSVKNCKIINPNFTDIELELDETCSICLENLINIDEPKQQTDILVINKCKHKFHVDCIYPWFNSKYIQHKDLDCPLCRTVVDNVEYKKDEVVIDVSGYSSDDSVSLSDFYD
uniref:RING-type domain-containing protein n=1 Tax=viral metagenome TaxID=1070528 RepID=A0A6C0IXQ9_9ZZZZ